MKQTKCFLFINKLDIDVICLKEIEVQIGDSQWFKNNFKEGLSSLPWQL